MTSLCPCQAAACVERRGLVEALRMAHELLRVVYVAPAQLDEPQTIAWWAEMHELDRRVETLLGVRRG